MYLDPIFWLVILSSGAVGGATAALVGRVAGAHVPQRIDARRLGLGALLFAPAPLVMMGAFGPLAGFLVVTVAGAVLGRQGKGPAVEPGEGSAVPLGWGNLLTRGVALATGSLTCFYMIIGLLTA